MKHLQITLEKNYMDVEKEWIMKLQQELNNEKVKSSLLQQDCQSLQQKCCYLENTVMVDLL